MSFDLVRVGGKRKLLAGQRPQRALIFTFGCEIRIQLGLAANRCRFECGTVCDLDNKSFVDEGLSDLGD
jgi:hypothetical protein